jgi:hypothetical protein
MTLKKQWATVKSNWLLIVLVLILIAAMNFSNIGGISYSLSQSSADYAKGGYGMAESAIAPRYYGDDGFAPDVVERKITKSANLATEIERGEFTIAEQRLKGILASANTILLSENVQKQDTERREYLQGWYTIKVDVNKYDALVAELKTLGEVQSFSESMDDITGQYTDLEDQLTTEKARLERYKQMYSEATRVEDKININDRIFNQEMQIKYLEDAIANMDLRVDYSTISLTMTEERSEYASVAIAKFSQLVRALVESFNNLLQLVFIIVPWALAAGIIWLIWNKVRKHNR